MTSDKKTNRDNGNVEKNKDEGERHIQEHYRDQEDRRPVFDDVTDTLKPPSRRDGNGGNNG